MRPSILIPEERWGKSWQSAGKRTSKPLKEGETAKGTAAVQIHAPRSAATFIIAKSF